MEEARSILNDNELSALKYYISQYLHGEVHVGGLVISLFHLFDSSTKVSSHLFLSQLHLTSSLLSAVNIAIFFIESFLQMGFEGKWLKNRLRANETVRVRLRRKDVYVPLT